MLQGRLVGGCVYSSLGFAPREPVIAQHLSNSGGSDGKSVCLQCGRPGFDPCVRKVPWRSNWHPTPVLSPGKSHGWKNLVGCSPWCCKESDTTERLSLSLSFTKQQPPLQPVLVTNLTF